MLPKARRELRNILQSSLLDPRSQRAKFRHQEDLEVDGMTILKQKLKEYYQSVGWIHLAYAGKEKLKLSV
jgi:hypothetical protein